MLKSKVFWVGFLVAYGLAYFLPPTALLKGRKKS